MKTPLTTHTLTLSRRRFLRGSTLAATSFLIVPGAVLGLRGQTAANSAARFKPENFRWGVTGGGRETRLQRSLEKWLISATGLAGC